MAMALSIDKIALTGRNGGEVRLEVSSQLLSRQLHPNGILQIEFDNLTDGRWPTFSSMQIAAVCTYLRSQAEILGNVHRALEADLSQYGDDVGARYSSRAGLLGCRLLSVTFPSPQSDTGAADPVLSAFGIAARVGEATAREADCILTVVRPWEDEHWLQIHLRNSTVVFLSQE